MPQNNFFSTLAWRGGLHTFSNKRYHIVLEPDCPVRSLGWVSSGSRTEIGGQVQLTGSLLRRTTLSLIEDWRRHES